MAFTLESPASELDELLAKAAVVHIKPLSTIYFVSGSPHPKTGTRNSYAVSFVRRGAPVCLFVYIPNDCRMIAPGAYEYLGVAHEDRPDCSCRDFRARCLDVNGVWNGGICKHIVPGLLNDWMLRIPAEKSTVLSHLNQSL
jgi:hypothetical protein